MNIALKLTIVIKVKSVKELSILLKETFVMVFILWMRILYSSLNMKFSKRRLNANTRRQNISNAERLKDYSELQKGDYVVHQIHGLVNI